MIKRIVHIQVFLLMITVLSAQQNNTMYFLEQLPQSQKLNPAFQNNYQWFVGIPVLSSFHFSYAHSGFSLGEVIEKDVDNYRINTSTLLSQLKRTNYLGAFMETDYLNLAFKKDDNYFTFSISDRADASLFYDKDNLDIIVNGTEGTEHFKLKSNGFYFNYFREYAFGYSRSFFERAYGFRAKVLFGKLNFSSRKANIDLQIENFTNVLSFEEELNIAFSLPYSVSYKDNGNTVLGINKKKEPWPKIFFEPKNVGIAFDAGYQFNVNYKFRVYASILDAGFILWNHRAFKMKSENTYKYTGFLYDNEFDQGIGNETIDNFISGSDFTGEQKSYLTFQPSKLYAGCKYDFSTYLNAGLLLKGQLYRQKLLTSATVSINSSFTDWFTSSVSYSLMYGTYQNIGFGITLGKSPTQLYFVTDNISNFTFPFRNKDVFLTNRLALWPFWTQNINFRVGLNINLRPGETMSLQRIKSDSSYGGSNEDEKRIQRLLRRQRSDRKYQKVLRRNITK